MTSSLLFIQSPTHPPTHPFKHIGRLSRRTTTTGPLWAKGDEDADLSAEFARRLEADEEVGR